MTIEIKVPAMGESVTEATVARWFKKEGDAVKRDEPLLELETDKVTVEVPAPADGAIESISVKAGDTVQVGALLGAIAEGKAGARHAAKPAAPKAAAPLPRPKRPSRAPAARQARRCPKPMSRPCRRPAASPRKPAFRPSSVAGTGKDGRVTKGDMLGALEARAVAPSRRPGPALRPAPQCGARRNACR